MDLAISLQEFKKIERLQYVYMKFVRSVKEICKKLVKSL